MTRPEINTCPMCGALPCDWCDDPYKVEFSLLAALASIRAKSGVGDKPMLSELADAIAHKLDQYPHIISLVRDSELEKQQEALDRVEMYLSWESPPLHEISEWSEKANRHGHALAVLRSIESGVAIESVPLKQNGPAVGTAGPGP